MDKASLIKSFNEVNKMVFDKMVPRFHNAKAILMTDDERKKYIKVEGHPEYEAKVYRCDFDRTGVFNFFGNVPLIRIILAEPLCSGKIYECFCVTYRDINGNRINLDDPHHVNNDIFKPEICGVDISSLLTTDKNEIFLNIEDAKLFRFVDFFILRVISKNSTKT